MCMYRSSLCVISRVVYSVLSLKVGFFGIYYYYLCFMLFGKLVSMNVCVNHYHAIPYSITLCSFMGHLAIKSGSGADPGGVSGVSGTPPPSQPKNNKETKSKN